MNIKELLDEIESLQSQAIAATDAPQEGQVRSSINEIVAFKMGKFGKYVADVELLYVEELDNLAHVREDKKITLMKSSDRQTRKFYTASKAESMVELDPEVMEQLAKVRKLKHQYTVLNNKSKSFWSWLDQSRSRLSWIGREVIHGS